MTLQGEEAAGNHSKRLDGQEVHVKFVAAGSWAQQQQQQSPGACTMYMHPMQEAIRACVYDLVTL